MPILYILFGLLLGAGILYIILRPKLKIVVQKNTELENLNLNINKENQQLTEKQKEISNQIKETDKELTSLIVKKNQLKISIKELEETQREAAKAIYDKTIEIAQFHCDQEIDNISKKVFEYREDAKNTYLDALKEAESEFQNQINQKRQELKELNEKLAAEQKNVDIAVEAAQRQVAMETQQDFYRLNLSNEDIMEINKLREVLPYLRDKEPLNKVIYQTYYAKPYSDLIGRVIGAGRHTGIYKITNLENGMCYVGQSVDIAERWRQHIKRGVGAEAPTRNKLYPAMLAFGVENFTFEVIEECSREQLDEREDYWQNYFHAKDFGYSIK